jgi:probable HAF family extracellular repeat protein
VRSTPKWFGVAINDAGQVVGNDVDVVSGRNGAFVWEDGVMTPLDPFPGYSQCAVVSITNNGYIIGRSYQPIAPGLTPSRATMWTVPVPAVNDLPPHPPMHAHPHVPLGVPPHAPTTGQTTVMHHS